METVKSMTSAERQALLDQLALHQTLTKRSMESRDLDMWSTELQEKLRDAIGAGDGGSYGLMLIKRSMGSTNVWRSIEGFMESAGFMEMRVIERLAVYRLLAGLLVDHAIKISRRGGAPMSLKLVTQCSSNLGGIFDQSFPGYLAAGLAPVIVKRLTQRVA